MSTATLSALPSVNGSTTTVNRLPDAEPVKPARKAKPVNTSLLSDQLYADVYGMPSDDGIRGRNRRTVKFTIAGAVHTLTTTTPSDPTIEAITRSIARDGQASLKSPSQPIAGHNAVQSIERTYGIIKATKAMLALASASAE